MQLNPDGKGGLTGSMTVNIEGENCRFDAQPGSAYSVNPNGTGTFDINWAEDTVMDSDSDVNCADLFGSGEPGSNFSEHFVMVLESGGRKVEFTSNDDFFSGSAFTTEQGDFLEYGSCLAQ